MSPNFKNSLIMNLIAWSISFIVIGFNVYLFLNYLDDLSWPTYAVVFGLIYFAFIVYLIYIPLEIPVDDKETEVVGNGGLA